MRYAAGLAPAKTTSTAASTAAPAQPRPADAALGSRTGSERRPARRRPAGRLRREQRLGQQRARRRRRGRRRPEHHGRGSRDHDEHRQALAQDVVSRSRARTSWVSLRSRALESLAHDAELRAWARNLGVTVKPSAVDAAVKPTLVERVPGQARRARIDQAKVDAEFKSTGMTRALLRSRTETKLLAAGRRQQGRRSRRRSRTRRSRRSTTKDKTTLYALPERRKLRHILVKDKALADQLYAQLAILGRELRRARQEVLDRQQQGRRAASSASSTAPASSSRSPTSRSRYARASSRSRSRRSSAGT